VKAIYLSGWQVAADANDAGQTYPDQSLYPAYSVPNVVRKINNALMRADQLHHMDGYADLIWCETSEPNLEEARRFAEAIHSKYPGKMLAYNCSPSFNWKKKLDDNVIASFQPELARGLQVSIRNTRWFPCAKPEHVRTRARIQRHRHDGLLPAARKEFAREAQYGYQAVKHQRFVGTGYFDAVTQVIAGEMSSTTALNGSTQQEQFAEIKAQVQPKHGPDAGCQPILGECPSPVAEIMPTEESLLPSGD